MPLYLSVTLGILSSILVIMLIVLTIKIISTANRINKLLDDVQDKMDSLEGVFNLLDKTTDVLTGVSDKVVELITLSLKKIFFKGKKEEDENE